MRSLVLVATALAAFACASDPDRNAGQSQAMTQVILEEVVRAIDPEARGPVSGLEFAHAGIGMACISDARHDRMRIVAPVGAVADLTSQQIRAILAANYHSALDARYGISQGILYAAFIHPLAPLTPEELYSAVRQVANLVLNFGTSYSSGELVYQEPGQPL